MNAIEFARGLALPEQTIAALEAIDVTAPPLDPSVDLSQYDGLTILRIFLEWIPELQKKYAALGIPETVFRDNLKDVTIWAQDYWEKHHVPGFAEWEWVSNSFFLKVFRIGRLQFEPSRLDADAPGYPAGTTVLEVHIPACEPLDERAVAEAMAAAPGFFRRHFGLEFPIFRCHSWLLCPKLKEILPASSRIIRFQDLFTVYGEDNERQAEERVFGAPLEDPRLYPEGTSLQRAMKCALLEGKTFGMGMGIRKIP